MAGGHSLHSYKYAHVYAHKQVAYVAAHKSDTVPSVMNEVCAWVSTLCSKLYACVCVCERERETERKTKFARVCSTSVGLFLFLICDCVLLQYLSFDISSLCFFLVSDTTR